MGEVVGTIRLVARIRLLSVSTTPTQPKPEYDAQSHCSRQLFAIANRYETSFSLADFDDTYRNRANTPTAATAFSRLESPTPPVPTPAP